MVIKKIISLILILSFGFAEISHANPEFVRTASSAENRPLSAANFIVPEKYAVIKEAYQGSAGPFIVHIQDAHTNLSGQENLAGALDEILSNHSLPTILLEGGSGDSSLNDIKSKASHSTWERVAKSFLVQGKLNGEEYLNLTGDRTMNLWGVENPALYQKSLEAYAKLTMFRENSLTYLKKIRHSLQKVKDRVYPETLLKYETLRSSSAEKSLQALARWIENQKNEELTKSAAALPQWSRAVPLLSREEEIDYEAANLEQAALLEQIHTQGGKDLLEKYLRPDRTKETPTARYKLLRSIFDLAKEKNVPLNNYPNLEKYAQFLEEFSQVDLEAMLAELESLDESVYKTYLQNEDMLRIHAIDRYTNLLMSAYQIQMTAKEFDLFDHNEHRMGSVPAVGYLNKKLLGFGLTEDLLSFDACLEKGKRVLREFYRSVRERDFAFMQNMEKVLQDKKPANAVLIAGGYHTQHLKKLFREKGYSYVVLTPYVTAETNQDKYEKELLKNIRQKKSSVTVTNSGRETSTLRGSPIMQDGARLAELLRAAQIPLNSINVPAFSLGNSQQILMENLAKLQTFRDRRPSFTFSGASAPALSQPDGRQAAGGRLTQQNPYHGDYFTAVHDFIDKDNHIRSAMYINSAGRAYDAMATVNPTILIMSDRLPFEGSIERSPDETITRAITSSGQMFVINERALRRVIEQKKTNLREQLMLSFENMGALTEYPQKISISKIQKSTDDWRITFLWRHPSEKKARFRTVYFLASRELENLKVTDFPEELLEQIQIEGGLDAFIEKAPNYYEVLGELEIIHSKAIDNSNALKKALLKEGGYVLGDNEASGSDSALKILLRESSDFRRVRKPFGLTWMEWARWLRWGNGPLEIAVRKSSGARLAKKDIADEIDRLKLQISRLGRNERTKRTRLGMKLEKLLFILSEQQHREKSNLNPDSQNDSGARLANWAENREKISKNIYMAQRFMNNAHRKLIGYEFSILGPDLSKEPTLVPANRRLETYLSSAGVLQTAVERPKPDFNYLHAQFLDLRTEIASDYSIWKTWGADKGISDILRDIHHAVRHIDVVVGVLEDYASGARLSKQSEISQLRLEMAGLEERLEHFKEDHHRKGRGKAMTTLSREIRRLQKKITRLEKSMHHTQPRDENRNISTPKSSESTSSGARLSNVENLVEKAVIEEAATSDLDELVTLQIESFESVLEFSHARPRWEIKEELSRTMDNHRNKVFVAKIDEKIVGAVQAGTGFEGNPKKGAIDTVVVDAAFRERGIGTQLFSKAMEWLKDEKKVNHVYIQDLSKGGVTGHIAVQHFGFSVYNKATSEYVWSRSSGKRTLGARLSQSDAQTRFQEFFGSKGDDVLRFLTGTATVADISGYRNREVPHHATKIIVKHFISLHNGKSVIFYSKSYSYDTPTSLRGEQRIIRRLSAEDITPPHSLIQGHFIILKAPGRRIGKRDFQDKTKVSTLQAMGYLLGKMHRLGIVHGDLTAGVDGPIRRDHVYIDREKPFEKAAQFIDVELARMGSSDQIQEERQRLYRALIFDLRRYGSEDAEFLVEKYFQGAYLEGLNYLSGARLAGMPAEMKDILRHRFEIIYQELDYLQDLLKKYRENSEIEHEDNDLTVTGTGIYSLPEELLNEAFLVRIEFMRQQAKEAEKLLFKRGLSALDLDEIYLNVASAWRQVEDADSLIESQRGIYLPFYEALREIEFESHNILLALVNHFGDPEAYSPSGYPRLVREAMQAMDQIIDGVDNIQMPIEKSGLDRFGHWNDFDEFLVQVQANLLALPYRENPRIGAPGGVAEHTQDIIYDKYWAEFDIAIHQIFGDRFNSELHVIENFLNFHRNGPSDQLQMTEIVLRDLLNVIELLDQEPVVWARFTDEAEKIRISLGDKSLSAQRKIVREYIFSAEPEDEDPIDAIIHEMAKYYFYLRGMRSEKGQLLYEGLRHQLITRPTPMTLGKNTMLKKFVDRLKALRDSIQKNDSTLELSVAQRSALVKNQPGRQAELNQLIEYAERLSTSGARLANAFETLEQAVASAKAKGVAFYLGHFSKKFGIDLQDVQQQKKVGEILAKYGFTEGPINEELGVTYVQSRGGRLSRGISDTLNGLDLPFDRETKKKILIGKFPELRRLRDIVLSDTRKLIEAEQSPRWTGNGKLLTFYYQTLFSLYDMLEMTLGGKAGPEADNALAEDFDRFLTAYLTIEFMRQDLRHLLGDEFFSADEALAQGTARLEDELTDLSLWIRKTLPHEFEKLAQTNHFKLRVAGLLEQRLKFVASYIHNDKFSGKAAQLSHGYYERSYQRLHQHLDELNYRVPDVYLGFVVKGDKSTIDKWLKRKGYDPSVVWTVVPTDMGLIYTVAPDEMAGRIFISDDASVRFYEFEVRESGLHFINERLKIPAWTEIMKRVTARPAEMLIPIVEPYDFFETVDPTLRENIETSLGSQGNAQLQADLDSIYDFQDNFWAKFKELFFDYSEKIRSARNEAAAKMMRKSRGFLARADTLRNKAAALIFFVDLSEKKSVFDSADAASHFAKYQPRGPEWYFYRPVRDLAVRSTLMAGLNKQMNEFAKFGILQKIRASKKGYGGNRGSFSIAPMGQRLIREFKTQAAENHTILNEKTAETDEAFYELMERVKNIVYPQKAKDSDEDAYDLDGETDFDIDGARLSTGVSTLATEVFYRRELSSDARRTILSLIPQDLLHELQDAGYELPSAFGLKPGAGTKGVLDYEIQNDRGSIRVYLFKDKNVTNNRFAEISIRFDGDVIHIGFGRFWKFDAANKRYPDVQDPGFSYFLHENLIPFAKSMQASGIEITRAYLSKETLELMGFHHERETIFEGDPVEVWRLNLIGMDGARLTIELSDLKALVDRVIAYATKELDQKIHARLEPEYSLNQGTGRLKTATVISSDGTQYFLLGEKHLHRDSLAQTAKFFEKHLEQMAANPEEWLFLIESLDRERPRLELDSREFALDFFARPTQIFPGIGDLLGVPSEDPEVDLFSFRGMRKLVNVVRRFHVGLTPLDIYAAFTVIMSKNYSYNLKIPGVKSSFFEYWQQIESDANESDFNHTIDSILIALWLNGKSELVDTVNKYFFGAAIKIDDSDIEFLTDLRLKYPKAKRIVFYGGSNHIDQLIRIVEESEERRGHSAVVLDHYSQADETGARLTSTVGNKFDKKIRRIENRIRKIIEKRGRSSDAGRALARLRQEIVDLRNDKIRAILTQRQSEIAKQSIHDSGARLAWGPTSMNGIISRAIRNSVLDIYISPDSQNPGSYVAEYSPGTDEPLVLTGEEFYEVVRTLKRRAGIDDYDSFAHRIAWKSGDKRIPINVQLSRDGKVVHIRLLDNINGARLAKRDKLAKLDRKIASIRQQLENTRRNASMSSHPQTLGRLVRQLSHLKDERERVIEESQKPDDVSGARLADKPEIVSAFLSGENPELVLKSLVFRSDTKSVVRIAADDEQSFEYLDALDFEPIIKNGDLRENVKKMIAAGNVTGVEKIPSKNRIVIHLAAPMEIMDGVSVSRVVLQLYGKDLRHAEGIAVHVRQIFDSKDGRLLKQKVYQDALVRYLESDLLKVATHVYGLPEDKQTRETIMALFRWSPSEILSEAEYGEILNQIVASKKVESAQRLEEEKVKKAAAAPPPQLPSLEEIRREKRIQKQKKKTAKMSASTQGLRTLSTNERLEKLKKDIDALQQMLSAVGPLIEVGMANSIAISFEPMNLSSLSMALNRFKQVAAEDLVNSDEFSKAVVNVAIEIPLFRNFLHKTMTSRDYMRMNVNLKQGMNLLQRQDFLGISFDILECIFDIQMTESSKSREFSWQQVEEFLVEAYTKEALGFEVTPEAIRAFKPFFEISDLRPDVVAHGLAILRRDHSNNNRFAENGARLADESLIKEDSELAALMKGLGIDLQVPIEAKKEGFWQYDVALTDRERDALHKYFIPTHESNNPREKTQLRLVFYDEKPLIFVSDGLKANQLPEHVRSENEANLKQMVTARVMKQNRRLRTPQVQTIVEREMKKLFANKKLALGYSVFPVITREDEELLKKATSWAEKNNPSPGTYSIGIVHHASVDGAMPAIFPGVYSPLTVSSNLFAIGIWPRKGTKLLIIGTGSGIDALTAAYRTQGDIKILSTDIDSLSLANARFNASRSPNAANIEFAQGDLFDLPGRPAEENFDTIYFNMPLPDAGDDDDIRTTDPRGVLLRRLLKEAPSHLSGSDSTLEINYTESPEFLLTMYEAGWEPVMIEGTEFSRTNFPRKLWDYARFVLIYRPSPPRSEEFIADLRELTKIYNDADKRPLNDGERKRALAIRTKYREKNDLDSVLVFKAAHTILLKSDGRPGLFPVKGTRINEKYSDLASQLLSSRPADYDRFQKGVSLFETSKQSGARLATIDNAFLAQKAKTQSIDLLHGLKSRKGGSYARIGFDQAIRRSALYKAIYRSALTRFRDRLEKERIALGYPTEKSLRSVLRQLITIAGWKGLSQTDKKNLLSLKRQIEALLITLERINEDTITPERGKDTQLPIFNKNSDDKTQETLGARLVQTNVHAKSDVQSSFDLNSLYQLAAASTNAFDKPFQFTNGNAVVQIVKEGKGARAVLYYIDRETAEKVSVAEIAITAQQLEKGRVLNESLRRSPRLVNLAERIIETPEVQVYNNNERLARSGERMIAKATAMTEWNSSVHEIKIYNIDELMKGQPADYFNEVLKPELEKLRASYKNNDALRNTSFVFYSENAAWNISSEPYAVGDNSVVTFISTAGIAADKYLEAQDILRRLNISTQITVGFSPLEAGQQGKGQALVYPIGASSFASSAITRLALDGSVPDLLQSFFKDLVGHTLAKTELGYLKDLKSTAQKNQHFNYLSIAFRVEKVDWNAFARFLKTIRQTEIMA